MKFSLQDKQWMQRAIKLAEKARGNTSPNPLVGAVLVKNRRIVGEGYHRKAGQAHAEVNAIKKAAKQAHNATLYVTLEPCSHFGRTPPCVDAILAAGIKRVVVGVKDPNPEVSGKGIAQLRWAGINVQLACERQACEDLNRYYLTSRLKQRPWVTLKMAQSLDGKIATRTGDSKWITSAQARKYGHQLRHDHDAVLVGINTILQDDPRLTPWMIKKSKKTPYRIVLDSKLKVNSRSKIFKDGPVIIATCSKNIKKIKQLENNGVHIIGMPKKATKISLNILLSNLLKLNILSVFIEGGGEVNAAFMQEGLVDHVVACVEPCFIGGKDAISSIGGKGIAKIDQAPYLVKPTLKQLGSTLIMEGRPCFQES